MEFRDLLDLCKAEAITSTLVPTEESVWRDLCRSYSKRFSTPLHLCLDGTISPEDIIKAEFEEQLSEYDEERDLDALLDQLYTLADPNYEREKTVELEEFMEKTEREENERIRLGKPIHKALANESGWGHLQKKEETFDPPQKSGSVNLAYLAREEENLGNFED